MPVRPSFAHRDAKVSQDTRLSFVTGAVEGGLFVSAGLVLLSWLLVAVVHVRDRFHVDHVSGVWMGLAKYTNEGVLYPPLYNGWAYGGTRYMPLKIVLDAGAARASGEYLVSGKVVALVIFAALLTIVFAALRDVGCSPPIAAGLAVLPLLTGNGFYAGTSNYGDALPVALELLAVVVIAGRVTEKRVSASGVLCALALFSKFSVVWAPAAIIVWLAFGVRRMLIRFVGTFVLMSAALFVLFELLTSGRFATNVFGLGAAGFEGLHSLVTQTSHELSTGLQDAAPGVLLLAPAALASLLLAAVRRTADPYQLSLLAALPVLLVVLSDVGASTNHLLDVEVLIVVVGGGLISSVPARYSRGTSIAVGTLVLVSLLWRYQATVWPSAREAARAAVGRETVSYPVSPLQRYVRPGEKLLSQDASIPISLGRTPVVLDPFMLLRIDREHPDWGQDLVDRLDRKVFDKVVMAGVPDPRARWWRVHHYGPRISAAIFRNYRRTTTVHGYSIYVPAQ